MVAEVLSVGLLEVPVGALKAIREAPGWQARRSSIVDTSSLTPAGEPVAGAIAAPGTRAELRTRRRPGHRRTAAAVDPTRAPEAGNSGSPAPGTRSTRATYPPTEPVTQPN